MRVLMISGDKKFGPGHPRYDLQRSAVEELAVVYWGRGSTRPEIPQGAFDVVTVQDPFWRGWFAVRVARRIGAKVNVQVHTDLCAQGFVKQALAQMVLRRADSIRAVSEKIKGQIADMNIATPVHVLPVYVEVGSFRNLVRVPHEQKTILWVGRFEKEKDPLSAIEIFAQVRKVIDAKLIMLGKGSLEGELVQQAKGLPVEFPGWQPPLPYYATADVLLTTSQYEGFGAAMVEALAAGVPVVAPNVGVAAEAGAVVVPRERLAEAAIQALQSNTRGELKLPLLSEQQWVQAWKESL